MTTRNPTRRCVIFGAATAPLATIAASTAIALSPTTIDPVFAAIEKHRRLQAETSRLIAARTKLEEHLPEEVTRGPRVATTPERDCTVTYIERTENYEIIRCERAPATTKCHYCTELSDLRSDAKQIPVEHRKAWFADREAAFKRDAQAQRAAQKASGLFQAKAREAKAFQGEIKATEELYATMPTSIAGIAALAHYARICDKEFGANSYELLRLIAKAAAKITA